MIAEAVLLATIGSFQPCAPFANTLREFQTTPCGTTTAAVFHSAAEAANIDPRIMMAGAIVSGKHCVSICASLNNDPLGYCAMAVPWGSFAAGIQGHTQRIHDQYILNGYSYLEGIAGAEGWDVSTAKTEFANLLGNPNNSIVPYSTSCCGDCNNNQSTEINELVYIINRTLCSVNCPPISNCAKQDANFDGRMDITDVIRDVISALDPCPGH